MLSRFRFARADSLFRLRQKTEGRSTGGSNTKKRRFPLSYPALLSSSSERN